MECTKYIDQIESDSDSHNNQILVAIHAKRNQDNQLTERPPKITPEQKRIFDQKLAMSLYMTNVPFVYVSSPYTVDAYRTMVPGYKLPHRSSLSGPLLNDAYQSVKRQVDEILASSYFLNIISNESENINKSRIINLSIHTDHGTFHYRSEDVGSMKFSSANIAQWIMARLEEIVKGFWEKINSFASDTCATM